MTVLSSIFFQGILLIAICGPPIIFGSDVTDLPEYDYQNKRLYTTTSAGEEEELSTGVYNYPSEEPDEIITDFDSKRKPTTTKKSNENDSFIHSSTHSSWTVPYSKSHKENSVKPSNDNFDKYNDDNNSESFSRKVTVKYNERTLPSEDSSSLPSGIKKFKNFETKNEETTTAGSGNNKFVSSHSSYEYSSSTVVQIDVNDSDEYTEEPELYPNNSSEHYKNIELKNSDVKKKNSKKESALDNLEPVDKLVSKTEKSLKDITLKEDKAIKNQENSRNFTLRNPEALDDYDSTINVSVIENDKAVKNISVNNEPGSNLLDIETVSSEISKNPKHEGISDVPQSVNSVIAKNIVTAENTETLNKTPTTKYFIKNSEFDLNNKSLSGFTSVQDAEKGLSINSTDHSKTLKLDDSKMLIPNVRWEQSNETTLKPTKVPDTDILFSNFSAYENNNDIKKKVFPFKKQPLVSSTPSTTTDNSKDVEIKTTTVTSTVPRINLELKNKLGLSSTLRTKSLSTMSSTFLDKFTTKQPPLTTMLPSTGNYVVSLKPSSSLSSSSYDNRSPENISEESFTTPAATTLSNDLLVKPITGFSTRKRPTIFSFLSPTTPSEAISTTDPSVATKVNFNYTISSYRTSKQPSFSDSHKLNNNQTISRTTTDSTTKIKPFVQWSTRLQKLITTTESVVETSVNPTSLTTDSDVSFTPEYLSASSVVSDPSTESSSTIGMWTRVSASTSSGSSSTTSSSSSSPDLLTTLSTSSDSQNFETSTSVTPGPSFETTFSSSVLTYASGSDPSFTKSNDFSSSNFTEPASFQSSGSTESSMSSSLLTTPYFSEKINLHNNSEGTESVSTLMSSTLPYLPDISVVDNSTEKSSLSDEISSVDTISEIADYASATTSSGFVNLSYGTSTVSMSSSSSSPSPSYLSSTTEDEEEFLYTSESADVFSTNGSSSLSPEVGLSSSDKPLFNTNYPMVTESIFDEMNSSHAFNNSNDYSSGNVTEESVSSVSNIQSTASTSLPSTYSISSTESSNSNASNLVTAEDVTTLSATTLHDSDGDDSYDTDDEWSVNNSSDHRTNKYKYSSTTPAIEHGVFLPVSPTYSDVDMDSDNDDEKSKNDTFLTTEMNHIDFDTTSPEISKFSITESPMFIGTKFDIFGNKSVINLTTGRQSFNNVTDSPSTKVKNYSSGNEILFTKPATEATTVILYVTESETSTQSTISTTSGTANKTQIIPNWTINNVPEYLVLNIDATLSEVCRSKDNLRKAIIHLFINGTGRILHPNQIIFLNLTPDRCNKDGSSCPAFVEMTFLNESGISISPNLIKDFLRLYSYKGLKKGLDYNVQDVQLMHQHQEVPEEIPDENNSTTIAAITISCIAVVCLLLLGILLIILRKRQKGFNYGQRCTPVSLDDYSLDNISVYNSVRRKNAIRASKRSYGNPAFDDPGAPSHPLNFAGLANFCSSRKSIDEEYSLIPMVSPKMDELPPGAETKNRYANVIPLPETRVHLSVSEGGEPLAEYINANYVKGPKGAEKFYIACQAPMQSTVNDFWKMIWEQQCKIILMLTDLHENGVEKCYDYLPPSEVLDCHRLFGDYQVTLKKREVREKYVISLLQLKNLETNLWREVTHMWYMNWPHQGVPDEGTSIIAFLIEARSYMRSTSGPHVIHCSPGTGRTGTVLAIDLCIREFEANRLVDIPKTVYALRRDRAGAVQTKDQYAFIYQVLNIYAAKLTGGALDSI